MLAMPAIAALSSFYAPSLLMKLNFTKFGLSPAVIVAALNLWCCLRETDGSANCIPSQLGPCAKVHRRSSPSISSHDPLRRSLLLTFVFAYPKWSDFTRRSRDCSGFQAYRFALRPVSGLNDNIVAFRSAVGACFTATATVGDLT